jgi:hypothetical protein
MKLMNTLLTIFCAACVSASHAQQGTETNESVRKRGKHVLVKQWIPAEALQSTADIDTPLSATESASVRQTLTQRWQTALPDRCFKRKVTECEWIYDEGLKFKKVCWSWFEIDCSP